MKDEKIPALNSRVAMCEHNLQAAVSVPSSHFAPFFSVRGFYSVFKIPGAIHIPWRESIFPLRKKLPTNKCSAAYFRMTRAASCLHSKIQTADTAHCLLLAKIGSHVGMPAKYTHR
jgi:hypothetical protein